MGVLYNGIELDGLDKEVGFYHSNALRAMGQDQNVNAEYLEKICEYKKADLTQEQFDEINKLWSVVKMNYQVCNGGIHQYFGNRFDEAWKSEDGETELWGKDEQVEMMRKLYGFACEVLPDNLPENSRFYRIIEFFDSLEYEEGVPQHGMVECDEDEEIWDEDLEEWVENPDYEEPYEDIVDYEDEVRTTNSAFKDWSDDVSDKFDNEYYAINDYIEKVVELYAQYLDKTIEKDKGFSVDELVEQVSARSAFGGYTIDQLEEMIADVNYIQRIKVAECGYGLDRLVSDPDARVRIAVAKKGYGLIDLMGDENEYVRKTAVNKLDEMNGHKPRYPEADLDF